MAAVKNLWASLSQGYRHRYSYLLPLPPPPKTAEEEDVSSCKSEKVSPGSGSDSSQPLPASSGKQSEPSCATQTPMCNHSIEQLQPMSLGRLKALLAASLAFNLSVFIMWFYATYCTDTTISTAQIVDLPYWTRTASAAAQVAASYNCSGHGLVSVDMVRLGEEKQIVCECEECFTGPDCADIVSNCEIEVDGGDPLMFESYWRENAEASAILIPGWYRMGYEFEQPLIPALEQEIRSLHAMVGNAVTEGRYILVGTGSTQLLLAALLSLSSDAQEVPVSAVAAAPYYEAYWRQLGLFKSARVKWAGSVDSYALLEGSAKGASIEIVTSPNNPDGSLRETVLTGSEAYSIYDHAYYWPHFTAITAPSDHDVMTFSLSKVTGHAGSRIGWAIIKDHNLYQKMLSVVRMNTVGVSHEAQLRATQLLRAVQDGYSKTEKPSMGKLSTQYAEEQLLFHYAYAKLRDRWEELTRVLEGSDRFSIQQDLEPKYCNFFKGMARPAPAFAWVRCDREGDQGDCAGALGRGGIIGRGGGRSGADDGYVRLAMVKTDFSFQNLVSRLQALLSSSSSSSSSSS